MLQQVSHTANQRGFTPYYYNLNILAEKAHYGCPMEEGRTLYFHPVVSSSIFFFSSPNLSHRKLDVYYTSTHGMALVQI